jgi:hypothetical protein
MAVFHARAAIRPKAAVMRAATFSITSFCISYDSLIEIARKRTDENGLVPKRQEFLTIQKLSADSK